MTLLLLIWKENAKKFHQGQYHNLFHNCLRIPNIMNGCFYSTVGDLFWYKNKQLMLLHFPKNCSLSHLYSLIPVISKLDFVKKSTCVYKILVSKILPLIKTTILDKTLASKRTFSYLQNPLENLATSEFKFADTLRMVNFKNFVI